MIRPISLAALLLLLSASAAAEEPTTYELRWKLRSAGVWPPAISGDRLVVKTADNLAAYSASSGRLLWSQTLGGLRLGEGTLAAGDKYVYVLGEDALHLLDLGDGRVVDKRPLREPNGVLYHDGSVYLSSAAGLQRFDPSARKLLQQAAGFQGELRGADGVHVAIFRQQSVSQGKASPKRLLVVNLRTGKASFEFKLLPLGVHQVARMAGGRLSFIDYTQRQPDGSNSRKLYYTEADYLRGKKIRDVALSTKYTSAAADSFWITVSPQGTVFFANHGKPREPSTLFAFDPEQGKTLWTRSGEMAAMGLLLHEGRLWTGASPGGEPQLIAYSPETGDVISRRPLDAPGMGSPALVAGGALLLRTRSSIYCLAPASAAVAVVPPVTKPPPPAAAGGWRLYRDRVAGYLIQLPDGWTFDRSAMRKLGGVRFVIPFVRGGSEGNAANAAKLATVHILTWEAAGRDAEGLWRSVYAQRARSSPGVQVGQVNRVALKGAGTAIVASYAFRNPAGQPVQMRSLCAISHGVAFELRAWVAPTAPPGLWQEVEGIFTRFETRLPGSM